MDSRRTGPQAGPTNRHPADELGEIRERLRRLKAREAALRDRLMACDPAGLQGAEWQAKVVPTRRQVLVRERLPAAILNDPRYWTTSTGAQLRLARREAGDATRAVARAADDDACVIEPFFD